MIRVLMVEKKRKYDLFLHKRIEKILKELKPDLVHTHLFTADIWGRLAAKNIGVPVLTTEHNTNYGEGFFRISVVCDDETLLKVFERMKKYGFYYEKEGLKTC